MTTPTLWRSRRGAVALVVVVLLLLCGAIVYLLRDTNPLQGTELFVVPDSQAAQHVGDPGTDPAEAEARRELAAIPMAEWFSGGTPAEIETRARNLAVQASAQDRLLVGVVYNLPNRDCRGYSSGTGLTSDDYRAWITALMRGLSIPDRPEFRALLVYEPDAVAHTAGDNPCLIGEAATERLSLMAETVALLKSNPGLFVYLDAGNPGWFRPAQIAPALQAAGAQQADGLAINVANFHTTPDNLQYGRELSELLGGKHFVVDTSRNGAGPYLGSGNDADDPVWCNPPDRRVGLRPTTDTGEAGVDAFLWVKHPDESDGSCRPGEPPAGHWMPGQAAALLR